VLIQVNCCCRTRFRLPPELWSRVVGALSGRLAGRRFTGLPGCRVAVRL